MKIGGAIAGDGREPAGEIVGIAQGGELGEGLEEDVLNKVFDLVGWNAGEQDTVDHAGVPRIEDAVGGAVAVLRGANQCGIRTRGIEREIHGCDACVG